MQPVRSLERQSGRGQRGQILVIAALAMVVMIGGVSLVLEAGNAYAHQRVAQNAVDAVANAGATVLAERLGGTPRTDADVLAAMNGMATANQLDTYTAYYTNLEGSLLKPDGAVTIDSSTAEMVGLADGGDATIPPTTRGVRVGGSQAFGTTFARAIGINQFTASADATARTGPLTGGQFMPVVFPVSPTNCDGSGGLADGNIDSPWRMSNPNLVDPALHPVGQEWIVPLCKTGGGSFMILDLDPSKNCYQEVMNPSSIQWDEFPVDVPTDPGNDCATKISNAVDDAHLQGTVVEIPICDENCSTEHGSGGTFHITRIAAFYLDYISYSNNPNNSACKLTTSPNYPDSSLLNILGSNGSSSCLVGWFVRYITSGPVGSGEIVHGEALGVQLIR